MSDKIKPSEVSEVLQQQLQEVNGSQQFDEEWLIAYRQRWRGSYLWSAQCRG